MIINCNMYIHTYVYGIIYLTAVDPLRSCSCVNASMTMGLRSACLTILLYLCFIFLANLFRLDSISFVSFDWLFS